ncbi:preQ(1) synthase, partial [Streptococcus pneumoniae]|uniref:preQ(1) synthase n=1 Tax=Streptococcus pneumoniae TaxID=1313 RepID=UPI001E53A46F
PLGEKRNHPGSKLRQGFWMVFRFGVNNWGYLFSYRNHGDFHENCINTIGKDLVNLLDPRYLEVWGKFTPRGGISIDPYYNYGKQGTKYEGLAEQRLFQHDLYPEKIDNR